MATIRQHRSPYILQINPNGPVDKWFDVQRFTIKAEAIARMRYVAKRSSTASFRVIRDPSLPFEDDALTRGQMVARKTGESK